MLRRIPLLFLAIATVLPMAGVTWAADEPVRRLNVLLIVADDLNTDLGCYGHALVKTPQLDRLARRGIRFDRAYCQDAVCNPSRTSMLSGRRPGDKLAGATFLPNFLHAQGYLAAEFGKVAHSYGPSRASCEWDLNEKAEPAAVAKLLKERTGQPLFLTIGLTHTHPGFAHTREMLERYPPESIELSREPESFVASVPEAAFAGIAVNRSLSDDERRKHIARYYAAISTLDAEVGKLLDALDEQKLWDDTVVVFTSDHGRHLGDHGGVYDKRTLFERSARVPLIVTAPGIKQGAACGRLVELLDLYPTLAELCGLAPPEGLHGTSFAPLLADPERAGKGAAFTVANRDGVTGRSVRTERYRYSHWQATGGSMLFDHETDPDERHNLAGDPAKAEIIREMQKLLETLESRPE